MNWDTIQQLVRIIAQFVGGYLVSAGLITEGLVQELTGGAISIAMLAWWAFWERHRENPNLPSV